MAKPNDLFAAIPEPEPRRPAREPRPAAPPAEAAYTAAHIEVLEGLEPVRRRPGMYIGGTDEKALHHLFAEVIDNSMDEAVAGHATFIDVEMTADGFITVTDNGRGIPVENHPKFPGKSTLEVILTVLHAGGKFDSKVYETSGGLHGVGASVVNALSDVLEVEVARNQVLYRQSYSRGIPQGKVQEVGRVQNRRGTRDALPARSADLRRGRALQAGPRVPHVALQGVSVRRRRGALELRRRAASPAPTSRRRRRSAFPAACAIISPATSRARPASIPTSSPARSPKPGGHGSVEWAVAWLGDADGGVSSYCNTIPTIEGGTHETGFRVALLRGLRDHAERTGNAKRAASITTDDVMAGCAAMLSVFIREPEFQGQTKEKLATSEATRIVETAIRDPFDHWLGGNPVQASKLLDWVVERAEERLRRRQEKEISRKTAVRKLRLPGKLADCSNNSAAGSEIFIVEGDSGRRLRQAGARAPDPGGAAAARQDPERRQRRQGQAGAEPAALRPDAGARLRHRHAVSRPGPAL